MKRFILVFSIFFMSIIAANGANAQSLNSGGQVSGALMANTSHSYTFSGLAGEAVTLTMAEAVASYGQIKLYKPNGSYWTAANNKMHVTLPDSGTYTAVVSFSNTTHSGTYTLRYVRGGSSVEFGALISGATTSSHLSTFDIDSYTFNGDAGEAITLIMEESASSYGQIYLYKPDGSYWAAVNNIAHVTLPVTGSYTVIASFSSLTDAGDYSLHYLRGGDDVEIGALSSGTTVAGSLDSYDMNSYYFGGMAGETITLILDEAASSYGQIFLYRPDGSYWASSNNIAHVTLPVSGNYTVVVRLSNIAQQGTYKLHYVLGGDDVENGVLVSGGSITHSLDTFDMNSYQFFGEAGETTTLMLDESESSYGQIFLYKPDGSYWAAANNMAHTTLPDTGTYTVVIRFSNIAQSGTYTLHYQRAGDAVENGYLTSGQTIAEILNGYDFDSFKFNCSAGQTITLMMEETESSYGQIFLYKPDGSYWTAGNNLAHVTLPQSGEYTVIVRNSNIAQAAAYQLQYLCAGESVENGSISSGSSVTTTLDAYDFDSYTFTASAGFLANFSMSESVSSYGQIYLYKPNGEYWAAGNNNVSVMVPVSGTYTVVVRFSNIAQNGSYQLGYLLSTP